MELGTLLFSDMISYRFYLKIKFSVKKKKFQENNIEIKINVFTTITSPLY